MSTSLHNRQSLTREDLRPELFSVLKTYTEDSHAARRCIKHLASGEIYLYDFVEEVDMVHGNDPQHRTYIPVADVAHADSLAALSSQTLQAMTPRLIDNWLADDTRTILWIS
jgi:hypothetical protein